MSNASNLSTLANVLDDGSDGQFLKSTGSGGVAFDTVAAGAVVYATADLLPLSGNSAGDMAYVTATNRFYINNGSGWYSVSLVNTNPSITSVQDAGSNTTPFTLATDQTATVVTVTAADPEEVPLTYGYSVTSGSLNGSTVTQGTGSNTNVFTVTPHASQEATFTLTFTASDGINQATSANAFSLSFVTVVTDSKYTTLLATATGTSDNDNITYIDGSGNSQNFTVTGSVAAGTFSPYRSGKYAVEFDSSDYLTIASHSDFAFGSGAFTIQFWIKPLSWNNCALIDFRPNSTNGPYPTIQLSGSGQLGYYKDGGGFGISQTSTTQLTLNEWQHIIYQRSGTTGTLYRNGSSIGSWSDSTNYSQSLLRIAYHAHNGAGFIGQLSNVRITTAADTVEIPTTPLTANSDTVFLGCSLPYFGDANSTPKTITVSSDPKIVAVGPYDYTEYSATDHGGSVYFDASNYATISNFNQQINGNFTLECWVYVTGSNATDDTFLKWGRLRLRSNNDSAVRDVSNIGGLSSTETNRWIHVVLDRSGNTLKAYKNGINFYNNTSYNASRVGSDGTESTVDASLYLGWDGSSEKFIGYISDLRIVSESLYGSYGTSTSTSNFTPPTEPLASNSNAILHFKGTDASIIDKSQRYNIDLGSTSIVGDSTTKWSGENSIYINSKSNSSDIITIPAGVLNASEPFTIEMWLKTNSGASSGFWAIYQDASNEMRLKMRGDDRIEFYHRGSGAAAQEVKDETNTYTLNNTDFYHVAITRDASAVFYLHQNGIKLGNFTANGNYDSSAVEFKIGTSAPGSSSYMNGYIQDFRITQGLARYTAADETSNIPTAPLEG